MFCYEHYFERIPKNHQLTQMQTEFDSLWAGIHTQDIKKLEDRLDRIFSGYNCDNCSVDIAESWRYFVNNYTLIFDKKRKEQEAIIKEQETLIKKRISSLKDMEFTEE